MSVLQDIIGLLPLKEEDRERFIRDAQRAYLHGTGNTYRWTSDAGKKKSGMVPIRDVINSIDLEGAEIHEILVGDASIGGVVTHFDEADHGRLDLIFVMPCAQGCGVGSAAWQVVERKHPEIRVWETVIPTIEERNRCFLVNRCGFRVIDSLGSCQSRPYDGRELSTAINVDEGILLWLEKVISVGNAAGEDAGRTIEEPNDGRSVILRYRDRRQCRHWRWEP